MLNTQDRRRLMLQMKDQPLVKAAIVLRCAAGLGVVALIAAIGTAEPDGRGADAPRVARMPAGTTVANGADAHRREVFAQRRQRFGSGDADTRQAETSSAIVSAEPK